MNLINNDEYTFFRVISNLIWNKIIEMHQPNFLKAQKTIHLMQLAKLN